MTTPAGASFAAALLRRLRRPQRCSAPATFARTPDGYY
ncbi:hypothetical protein PtrV1_10655 [Pyrenophora tritici-repentis]|uniref:Uncharacterized protein n=1 Tax=Pyrenophora tritici-repentis TaxID=45151 RepID=A0A5M9KWP7_9PLEO|nr:hypothetical protein PtrV1_10655 [Pyrenophora tritici-repentis]KAF7444147.1 hypothetical protein A1F99_122210 [Pyrenophora tritici-repentis]KAF7566070.1 hypothetical protein PtrM4_143900 [Pyrenophora tritici-repentis]